MNIHPLPNVTYRGKGYDMGVFMSKQLCLRPFRDLCLASWEERKPLNMDEDNVASQYKDTEGWTIHRKRAWTALMCGAHYDYIDFSIINYCETGTEESRHCIRAWIGHLSHFIHSFDLASSRPLQGRIHGLPEFVCESVFGVPGADYAVYLADARELGSPGAGDPIQFEMQFEVPPGKYQMAAFSPTIGQSSPWIPTTSEGSINVTTPIFEHDLTIRVRV